MNHSKICIVLLWETSDQMKPGQVSHMAVFFKLAASSFINAAYYYGRARVSELETVHKLGQSFHILKNF